MRGATDFAVNRGAAGQQGPGWIDDHGTAGLVSVIIPTFNRASLLMDLLDCLAAQSWPSLEILVVDDGSTDDTRRRVADCAAGHPRPVSLIAQDNAGPAAARNRGMRQARGEFIYLIDSDDLAFPSAIEDMVLALRASGRSYCLASTRNTDLDAVPIAFDIQGAPRYDPRCVVRSTWMTHGALYHRSAIAAAGPFDEHLRTGEDSEHRWRVVATNGPCHILKQTVGVRRIHPYGHLSVGRDDADLFRHANDASYRFITWASARAGMNRSTRRALVRNIFIFTVRLGALACWEDVAHGRHAMAVLGRFGGAGARAARLLTAPRTGAYFVVVLAVMNAGRRARNGLLWVFYSLQGHRRANPARIGPGRY